MFSYSRYVSALQISMLLWGKYEAVFEGVAPFLLGDLSCCRVGRQLLI